IADDDCLFDIDAGICEFDNLSIGTAQCVAGSAERLGQQCDSVADCGYNTSGSGGGGLCMGINLTSEQEKYIGGGWQAGEQKLSQLFAKSYDVWEWQWVAGSEGNPGKMQYVSVNNSCDERDKVLGVCPEAKTFGWDVSKSDINNKPQVKNIKVNNFTDDVTYTGPKTISLTFNSEVASDHLPLTGYRVDWGDGMPITSVSNLRIRDKRGDDKHILFHTYECDEADKQCEFKPKVQIKDNWGWCSNGVNGNKCPEDSVEAWASFGWEVIIKKQ
ncbi:hypothetical protein KKC16_02270, partial [Patescibacteria group bacterium]|nr:hypothetical protein [Patescibacteria group bacterium]